MERFLAICHPLHLYTMSGLQRAVRIIAALWVVSFVSAVPFAVFTKIHYLKYPKSKFFLFFPLTLIFFMSYKRYLVPIFQWYPMLNNNHLITANQDIPDSAFCAMLDNPDKFPLWELSTCIFFAFPMVIMIILYGRMGLKIRSRTRQSVVLGEHTLSFYFLPSSLLVLFVSIKWAEYGTITLWNDYDCWWRRDVYLHQ